MFFRTAFAAMLIASSALAGPPLTTIQDVLYKADGTRFNGTVVISWSSFEAPDQSAIATQMITVRVLEGNLRVQLVPNTNTNPLQYYTVVYNSDGHVQFSETWAVPAVAVALRIRDVRVATGNSTGNDTGTTSIQENQVVGLMSDLNTRPLKGPAYATGRVAMVDSSGYIDGVSGNTGDCVHVDGSSGPCGPPQTSFMDGDNPSGIVDGANTIFTLSGTPTPAGSLAVYVNGLLQTPVADYTLTNNNVLRFVAASAPQPGDTLLATYRLTGSTSTAQLFPNPQVLCSATGGTVSSSSFTSLGSCTVPANTLTGGDRVRIQFDLAHQGTASGFTFAVNWGATTILQRNGTASDAQVSGHAEAGLDQAGAQISTQSWGTSLAFSATLASAADAYTSGLVITFQGLMATPGDTLTLRNYTVVRLP
jgi:hypothetical protein